MRGQIVLLAIPQSVAHKENSEDNSSGYSGKEELGDVRIGQAGEDYEQNARGNQRAEYGGHGNHR